MNYLTTEEHNARCQQFVDDEREADREPIEADGNGNDNPDPFEWMVQEALNPELRRFYDRH